MLGCSGAIRVARPARSYRRRAASEVAAKATTQTASGISVGYQYSCMVFMVNLSGTRPFAPCYGIAPPEHYYRGYTLAALSVRHSVSHPSGCKHLGQRARVPGYSVVSAPAIPYQGPYKRARRVVSGCRSAPTKRCIAVDVPGQLRA